MTAVAINTAHLDPDTVREALEYISENLRTADADEIAATTREDPFWALFESWEGSTASWLILDLSGLPLGVFGVAPHVVSGLGVAWLIGTPGIEQAALSVGRQTQRFVEEMNALYPILWANVDARNELSMRWLEWAGFQVSDANPSFGPEGRLFLQYVRTA